MITRRHFLRLPFVAAVSAIGVRIAQSKTAAIDPMQVVIKADALASHDSPPQRYLIRSWNASILVAEDAVYFSFPSSWKTSWH